VAVKFKNNSFSTLSAGINNSTTSVTVADGSKFPTLGGSDHMYLTIVGSSANEIIKVTSVSTNTLTCVRGQDDTSAIPADSGDRVELRITTAMLQDAFSSSFTNITDGSNIIVADSTTDTLNITGTGGATVTNTPGTATITIDAPAAGASKGFATAMAIAL
jgi:hypothetical protein|tara:strand:+ start:189 stop:671 length:483 start_codon:yes stop_codon:yes gene_type:complete